PITGSTCSWPPSKNLERTVFRWGLCPHTPEIFRFAPGSRPAEINPISAASRPQNRRSSCVSAEPCLPSWYRLVYRYTRRWCCNDVYLPHTLGRLDQNRVPIEADPLW